MKNFKIHLKNIKFDYYVDGYEMNKNKLDLALTSSVGEKIYIKKQYITLLSKFGLSSEFSSKN